MTDIKEKKDDRGTVRLPREIHREIDLFATEQQSTVVATVITAWEEYKENHNISISMSVTFEPTPRPAKKGRMGVMGPGRR